MSVCAFALVCFCLVSVCHVILADPLPIPSIANFATLTDLPTYLSGVQYSAVFLYNVGRESFAQSIPNSPGFNLVPASALIPGSAFQVAPIWCLNDLFSCKADSTIQGLGQPLAVQTPEHAYWKIQGGVKNSTVLGNPVINQYDFIPQNDDAFYFNSLMIGATASPSPVYIIQPVNGYLAVVPTSDAQPFQLNYDNVSELDIFWALYGFLPRAAKAGSVMAPLISLQDTSKYSSVLLYNLGANGAVQGSDGPSIVMTAVDLSVALTSALSVMQLTAVNCPSYTGFSACNTTTSSGSSSQAYAVQVVNRSCNVGAGNSYWNLFGGADFTNVNASIVSWCDSVVQNNEAFYFLPVSIPGVSVPVYQIQAPNTNNGNFCVSPLQVSESGVGLIPCDESAQSLWAFYGLP